MVSIFEIRRQEMTTHQLILLPSDRNITWEVILKVCGSVHWSADICLLVFIAYVQHLTLIKFGCALLWYKFWASLKYLAEFILPERISSCVAVIVPFTSSVPPIFVFMVINY